MGFELYKGYFKEGKIRAGNRGGLGLFNWDQVKGNDYKANYLGNSVMASEGRWQNHKDIHWYHSKKKEVDAQVQLDEVAEIKRLEEKAMREALGIHEEETIEEDEETIKEKERIRREEIKASLVNSRDEKVVGMGQRGERRRELEKAAKKHNHRDYSPRPRHDEYKRAKSPERSVRRGERERRRSRSPRDKDESGIVRDRRRSRSPRDRDERRERYKNEYSRHNDSYKRAESPRESTSRHYSSRREDPDRQYSLNKERGYDRRDDRYEVSKSTRERK